MMANQFLSKIRVAQEDLVAWGDASALDRHQELRRLLADRAGPETAAIFAEPLVSHGNDAAAPSVAWYSETVGEPVPLDTLTTAQRERVTAYLSDHLRPVKALAENPETSDAAWAALTTYGTSDVVVVDDKPVIINWGLMPGGQGANASARSAHFQATLGQFLQMPERTAPKAVPVTPPTEAVMQKPADPTPPVRLSALAWVPLLVLLLLAGGVLMWLLQPGTRLFPAERPVITEEGTLAAQTALNGDLRKRIATLETALEGAVCRADGVLIMPDGRTPEGLLPPKEGTAFPQQASASAQSLLPNKADRVVVPTPEDAEGAQSLLDYIEARTVLVLAEGSEGVAAGSGFVIGPGRILTNQHVVGEDASARVVVIGKSLPEPLPAQILRQAGPLAETGSDFALLSVEAPDLPQFALHLPQGSLRLSNVIAAGFPADVLELDLNFAGLMTGETDAVPALTVTDGTINTEQKLSPQTNVLMHSAPLSTGNSGGPLVDMCGRVVGINSFVRKGPLQNRGYALAVSDILAFLDTAGVEASVVTENCAPQVRPHVAQSAKAE